MSYVRPLKIISVLVSLLIVGWLCAILVFPAESEPRYNGKGIREWTLGMSYGTPEQIQEGKSAIRACGPSAVPYLIRMLEKRDSRLDLWLRKTFANIPFAFWFDDQVSSSHSIAATALRELGPAAQRALPALERVARGQDSLARYKAKAALIVIRSESSGALVRILEDRSSPNWSNWLAAASIAEEMGDQARPFIPLFIDSLADTNSRIRFKATSALGAIALEPDVCVPAILRGLNDSDSIVRHESIFILRRFPGAVARAQTEIQRCLADPDQITRFMAVFVLSETVSSLDSNSVARAAQPLLNDPDPSTRSMAEKLFKELRDKRR